MFMPHDSLKFIVSYCRVVVILVHEAVNNSGGVIAVTREGEMNGDGRWLVVVRRWSEMVTAGRKGHDDDPMHGGRLPRVKGLGKRCMTGKQGR
ncbi:hypothetical protein L1987_54176 [Smallanthus sonchifolius]|uniref:Uncharacterized protein n=1 Tax=Smallanthus sonchifolius TaxID=185202 RepID=A0ACB9E724_9ASTR|nr:hypothetical protein L1987_54176 [Smallanthus sonchifolius]